MRGGGSDSFIISGLLFRLISGVFKPTKSFEEKLYLLFSDVHRAFVKHPLRVKKTLGIRNEKKFKGSKLGAILRLFAWS